MTMAPEEPDALKTKPVPVSHWEYEEEGPGSGRGRTAGGRATA